MTNQQVSYFLIGGSGFLGNAFMQYLAQHNIEAFNITRGEISDSKSIHFRLEILDRLPVSSIKNIIVDFAYTSVPNTSFYDPVRDFSENLYNINSHLEFATKLPNATYIYISSGGTVYGNVHERQPIKEAHPNTPLSPYGITKLASEKYSLMYNEIYGLDVKIVRPANIYGPGQKPFRGQGFISTAIAKLLLNQPIQIFGDGTTIRDYLYIDDFCKTLYSIIDKGINGGIYNVGTGIGQTTNHILNLIKDQFHEENEPKIEYLPARPFDVMYNVLDCTKVQAFDHSHKQASLEEGIVHSYNWLKQYLRRS